MKILITTSRKPSRRTRSFLKELAMVIPASVRIARGKMTLQDLYGLAMDLRAGGMIVVYERKGNPSALTYYEISSEGLHKVLLVKLGSVKLRREVSDSQRPINITHLFIDYDESSKEVVNAFIKMFYVSGYTGPAGNLIDAVKILITRDEVTQQMLVRFLCMGSGRVCGPQLIVERVVWY